MAIRLYIVAKISDKSVIEYGQRDGIDETSQQNLFLEAIASRC